MNRKDREFWRHVSQFSFWENDQSTAVPQTCVERLVTEHFERQSDRGKRKKALLIGYDGCRADGLCLLLDGGEKVGCGDTLRHSGLAELARDGGKFYLAYCGGEKGTSTQQYTSTAPGWVSFLTGKWGKDTGVTNNGMRKKLDAKTCLLRLAEEKGVTTLFAEQWAEHFDLTYRDEIAYLQEHPQIPMEYRKLESDRQMQEYLLNRLQASDTPDAIFCVYEATDYNGHASGFSLENYRYVRAIIDEDQYAYDLIRAVKERPSYEDEDWLIVIGSDHGGNRRGHGNQTQGERTVWIACNRPIPRTYFSDGYDGWRIRK